MLKLDKRLFYLGGSVILLLFAASIVPSVRAPLLNTLKLPLVPFKFLECEVKAIVFYHRNFVVNQRLAKEVDLLKYRLNQEREIYLENKRLKEILSFKQKAPYRVIAARVISRSPENWSSMIVVDKGEYSGIKRGAVVINYLGLVGRVSEITKSSSKVTLINDPNLGVSGIAQRSRQEGLISGTLGNSLIMKYLPRDSDIKVSDIVVTSGLTGVYPKGLLIGTVIDVADEFSGLSCYAVIKPAVDLSNLEEVLVIVS